MNDLPGFLQPPADLRRAGKPVRVFGIDLGTTNSSIAEIRWDPRRGGRPSVRCLDVPQGDKGDCTGPLVPSIVSTAGHPSLVGWSAKRLAARMGEIGCEAERDVFVGTKNEMGLLRSYPEAPAGFRTPPEIASHILRFLRESALADDPAAPDAIAIGVPASFQTAQRKDTIEAARMAKLEVPEGALLDEPTAAFLDWIAEHGTSELGLAPNRPANVLVFDFGGGTCDVAILRVTASPGDGRLKTSALAVSRYQRLGGGDIDAAIVEEVLVPLLAKQNDLAPFTLEYDDKARAILPAFRLLAEELKTKLCDRVCSRPPEAVAKPGFSPGVKIPGVFPVRLSDGSRLTLTDPALSVDAFEKLLGPFLDRDFLYARETDYRMTCSIFAPLTEVLDRAGLDPHQVHCVLLAGGSSQVPQIREAVGAFFASAHLLSFGSALSAQTAVARGAAWHAFALALTGRGVVEPVCGDRIAIQTTSGAVELVPSGSPLPFPSADGWAHHLGLALPRPSFPAPLELRIELVGSENRPLGSEIWTIREPANRSAPLAVSYRLDANQDLHVRLSVEDGPWREMLFENPLTNLVNPGSKRARILELERKVTREALPEPDRVDTTTEIASLYGELGMREKAVDVLRRLLREMGGADAGLLVDLARAYGSLGDHARQEKCLLESARIAPRWSTPAFNLAVARHRRGLDRDALEDVEEAIAREAEGPAWVLKAEIERALDEPFEDSLRTGMKMFDPVSVLNDWELFWFQRGAALRARPDQVELARAERRRRLQAEDEAPPRGVLPELAPALRRSERVN